MAHRWANCGAAVAVAVSLLSCGGTGDDRPDIDGTILEVVGVWEGTEAAAFREVLAAFEARTGASVA